MRLPSAEERVGTVIGGKYRIERVLGQGGMGVVFAGVQERLRRPVAIKFLHAQYAGDADVVRRFFAEAQAAARLNHPNVVAIHDFDQTDEGSAYMVLELLEGESLRACLARRGPLGASEVIELIAPVVDALAAAHQAGIIHRDLKPENVFLSRTAGGRLVPKVLDFGIAKLSSSPAGNSTVTGAVIGTPAYMAPEQAAGQKSIGPWTDVWALAVLVYECLSGRLPFDFEREAPPTVSLVKILVDEPRPLASVAPDVPARVARAVDRALSKDPASRTASVRALFADLTGETVPMAMAETLPSPDALPPSPGQVTPFGWESPPPKRARGRRAWLVGGAALASFAIAVAVYFASGPDSPVQAAAEGSAAVRQPLPEPPPSPVPANADLRAPSASASADAGALRSARPVNPRKSGRPSTRAATSASSRTSDVPEPAPVLPGPGTGTYRLAPPATGEDFK